MTIFSAIDLADAVALKQNYDAIVALQNRLQAITDFNQFSFVYATQAGTQTPAIASAEVVSTLNWGDINEVQQVVRNMIIARMTAQKNLIKGKLLAYGFDIDSLNTVT